MDEIDWSTGYTFYKNVVQQEIDIVYLDIRVIAIVLSRLDHGNFQI